MSVARILDELRKDLSLDFVIVYDKDLGWNIYEVRKGMRHFVKSKLYLSGVAEYLKDCYIVEAVLQSGVS